MPNLNFDKRYNLNATNSLFALLLSDNLLCVLVIAQRHESAMPQVTVCSPLYELKLPNKHWLQPPALRHLRGR
jgi:hypothetical protein